MRRRFVLVSLAVTALVVAAFAAPLAWVVRSVAYDRAMSAAEREVVAISTVLAVTGDGGEIHRAVASTRAGRAHRLTVHLPGNRTVGRSQGWADAATTMAVARSGRYRTVPVPGGVAHLHPASTVAAGSRAAAGTAVIEILVPDADLHRGVHAAWAGLTLVSLLLLFGSALLTDRLAASAVRAIRQLADAAGRLGEGDLSARVRPHGPPEIATVGAAFNDLAGRFGTLLAGERELVADLSHRLRTPLTALRLGVEALPAGAERDRLHTATDSVEREVDAVIARAREPLAVAPAASCDLRAVVAERVAFWSTLAEDQGRDWALAPGPVAVTVPVPTAELESALDSVLGNIFHHTEEGVGFAVRVVVDAARATVTVDDSGPGIPIPVRRGRSDSSTGLGLSIARRVAGSAGGALQVSRSPMGGARITMSFDRVPVSARGGPP